MSSNNRQTRSMTLRNQKLIGNTTNQPISEDRKTIHDLPVELLPLIFEHLNLSDLPDCRLVSQLWKYYIDRVKITELILSNVYTTELKWIFDMKPVNIESSVSCNRFLLKKCPFELVNVRRLYLYVDLNIKDFEKILKLLPKVHHLQTLDLLGIERYTFDLPELKKLHIGIIGPGHIIVNSKIDTLSSYQIQRIECTYPLDIKTLQLYYWNDLNSTIYKNIECLVVMFSKALKSLVNSEIVWNELQNLKSIKCYNRFGESESLWMSSIDELTKKRSELGREQNLKINFNDGELIGTKKLEEYGF